MSKFLFSCPWPPVNECSLFTHRSLLVEQSKSLFQFCPHRLWIWVLKRHVRAKKESRGEQLLQTHVLIGQEVQLPSSDWRRAPDLNLLSNQIMCL